MAHEGDGSGDAALTIATINLWGLNEPWRYMADRGIVRGAVPGSPAVTMRPPGGVWARRRPLLAREIARVGPDVVALQEVRAGEGVELGSPARQLADDLGYRSLDRPKMRIGRGGEEVAKGLGVLSRHPILEAARVPLGPAGAAALHVVVDALVGAVDLVVVHLTANDEARQLEEARGLRAYLDGLSPGRALLVAGDFNAEPESPTMRLLTTPLGPGGLALTDVWVVARPGEVGATMPSELPTSRIDHILAGPEWRVRGAELLGLEPDGDGFYPSDHLGVVARLARAGP